MTETESLLRAIGANRDDNTVRLAYADHLDELGGEVNEAHAEYIRLQVRHHQFPSLASDSARESYLFRTFASRWRPRIPGFEINLHSRRGFPCRAAATSSAVLKAIDDPFSWLFDELTFTAEGIDKNLAAALRSPLVTGLTDLRIWAGEGTIGSFCVAVLTQNSFPRLERLNLSGLWLTDYDVRALCAASGLPRLEAIDLSSNRISGGGGAALCAAPLASRLRHLDLRNNVIGPASAIQISQRFGSVLVGGLP